MMESMAYAGLTAGVMAVIAICYAIAWLIGIAIYILHGIGLMKIAKSLDIPYAWRSFIPVASEFLVGRVAEKSEKSLAKGKKHAARILICEVACFITSFVATFSYVVGVLSENPILMLIFIFSLLLTIVASITYFVFYCIALYNVYTIVSPENATLFIVLSILFDGLAAPIIFFCTRNNIEKRANIE